MLMVVVLPAPLRPRKPKIEPCGTLRSTPLSTCLFPKRFVRPLISIIASGMALLLRLGRELVQLLVEQAVKFVAGELEVPGEHDGLGDGLGDTTAAFGEAKRGTTLGDESSVTMAAVDEAAALG